MKFTTLAVLALGAVAQLTGAAPVAEEKRDVYAPPVTYPHAGTVWYSGQRHNVTWYVCRKTLHHIHAADVTIGMPLTPQSLSLTVPSSS